MIIKMSYNLKFLKINNQNNKIGIFQLITNKYKKFLNNFKIIILNQILSSINLIKIFKYPLIK